MAKHESKEQLSMTIARHYDNGENNLSARNESRILYLRNFNNWVKSTLIKEAGEFLNEFGIRDKNVLDLACGKGGDLNKWRNMNGIKNLVAADISNGSITNCKSRYEDMKRRSKDSLFKAKFIVADCTRVMINQFFINTKAPIHLVSCQFAFHYCFESIQQAQCMLRNISENLVSGGLFIGTIPNADEIVRRLKNCDNKKFGNSIYSIEFECNTDKLPLFGAKYNFHLEGVVDCPEFLVHFPLLIELAKKFGLELKMKMNFSEYFKKYSILDLKFLSRIRALELYPPHNGNKTMGIDEEYIKAKQFLVDSNINSVGTLTVSEWEVATLYMVFMFQKT